MAEDPTLTRTIRQELLESCPGLRVSSDPTDRNNYAHDLWPRHFLLSEPRPGPQIVAWPSNSHEVAAIVQFASAHGLSIVPFGGGSGVCGGVCPDRNSIVIDLKRLNRVAPIDHDNLAVTAEAGIFGQNLEDHLNQAGYTLGHFPSSISCSTLGGWLATRSAGQCSGRYGKIEDMVLGIQAIDGQARHISASLDAVHGALIPLLIGNEGTLCIFTQAILRLNPLPPHRLFAAFDFENVGDGLEALREAYQDGLRPAVSRLYDPIDSAFAKRHQYKDTDTSQPINHALVLRSRHRFVYGRLLRYPHMLSFGRNTLENLGIYRPLLILVWEDHEKIATQEFRHFCQVAHRHGGEHVGDRPARHWFKNRYSISYRQSLVMAAGAFVDTMEVSAHWSVLETIYNEVRKTLSQHAFVMAHFSHAYPSGASIYFTFARHPGNRSHSVQIYDQAWREALDQVLLLGGSISHHHGVGRSKRHAMQEEHGDGLKELYALKRVFDPFSVLNPGVLIPPHKAMQSSKSEPQHAPRNHP